MFGSVLLPSIVYLLVLLCVFLHWFFRCPFPNAMVQLLLHPKILASLLTAFMIFGITCGLYVQANSLAEKKRSELCTKILQSEKLGAKQDWQKELIEYLACPVETVPKV
jgi:hypothetical protein